MNPTYKVNDVIYLRDSAMIGRLEAYRVDRVKYDIKYGWLYCAVIHMGGPETDTVIDHYNLKHVSSLWFRESDLIPVCDAATMAIDTLRHRLNSLNARRDLIGKREPSDKPSLEPGMPVYIRESAAIGFIERVYITNIMQDNLTRAWVYQITRPGINVEFQKDLWYRDDELVDDMAAVNLAIDYVTTELGQLLIMQETVCR
jgi:hypothetical protein